MKKNRENRAAHAADVRNRLVNQSVEDAEKAAKPAPAKPTDKPGGDDGQQRQ